jgi:parallel beta-helix repeat protein
MNRNLALIMTLVVFIGTLILAFNTQPVKATPTTIIVPDDFPTIQAAINNASAGDTIFVRTETYFENVVVNKTVSLIGENKENTIIAAAVATGNTLELTANGILVSNFTIGWGAAGIDMENSGNTIINNIIKENTNGATGALYTHTILENNIVTENTYGLNFGQLNGPSSVNNTAKNNEIYNNSVAGIYVSAANGNNTIVGNNIHNNGIGIVLDHTQNNSIINNYITNNNMIGGYMYGIYMRDATQNNIKANLFEYNNVGIHFESSNNNKIYYNNFVGNGKQIDGSALNIWDNGSKGNYWSDYLTQNPNAVANLTSGTWNTPYVIDSNNIDYYPLVNEVVVAEFPSSFILALFMIATLLAVIFYKITPRLKCEKSLLHLQKK